MATTLNIQKPPLTSLDNQRLSQTKRLVVAMFASLMMHIIVLAGITFKLPAPDFDKIATSLEVVLVNNKSLSEPTKTETLAQANLDGGGNTDDNRQVKTPFPLLPKSKPSLDDAAIQQKVKQLEQQAKQLMSTVESTHQIDQLDSTTPPAQKQTISDSTELLQQGLDIARLQAQIAKDHEAYQKRPKRKFIGARTKEYRFARYVEDWRIKVERIGNLNYPEAARKGKLYGNLQLTVGIRADGSLESIGVNRSSGEKILDEAAIRIVRLAGQNGFAPFPPDIRRDTDILHITRTWVFTRSDQLLSQ